MKFKIRYADQIVGILTIGAFVALLVFILMLGSKQRWFARDYLFTTTFTSATGITNGMSLQYKGFPIGKIKHISLNSKDEVDTTFVIYDTYRNRVKEGSLIELLINPIGLGNQFLFHPGNGETLIPEGSFIPRTDSPEGKALIKSGLATIQKKDDTITNLIAQVNPLLTNINESLSQLNGAFSGTGKGPLADTLSGVAKTVDNVSGITAGVEASLETLLTDVSQATKNITAITKNIETLSLEISDPTGLVPKLIDPDGKLFGSLNNSLSAVEGTLSNVEETSQLLITQAPQIAGLIEDLRRALVQGQEVLEGIKNNPLIKKGVSPKTKSDGSAPNARTVDF
ncbi:MAG TPA: MlaD family protein [Treponemataceae bacterium]|nr:MlaD family protein [Treponemataceae bacterium]